MDDTWPWASPTDGITTASKPDVSDYEIDLDASKKRNGANMTSNVSLGTPSATWATSTITSGNSNVNTASNVSIGQLTSSSLQDGLDETDLTITIKGKSIKVGAMIDELELYKTVFATALEELGIDVNKRVEQQKFLDKLSEDPSPHI